MSNKIFKNNQVTYGMPFQVRVPIALQNLKMLEEVQEPEEIVETTEKPEDIIEQAHEEAALIIKEATYEARRIVEDAYTEASEKAEAMVDEAWQKGFAEGSEAAQKQYEGIIAEAEEIKQSAKVEHDDVLAGLEKEIIELVLDISKKVIGNEIESNKNSVLSLVKQALEKCSNKNNIVIKVSPEDYIYLSANMNKLEETVGGVDGLEIKQDLSMKPGACVLDTQFGSMDAGAQTKFQKIEEAFCELLEGK